MPKICLVALVCMASVKIAEDALEAKKRLCQVADLQKEVNRLQEETKEMERLRSKMVRFRSENERLKSA